MTIFRCKMCGGTLEIDGSQSTATCEYCGTQQTLPRLDDDKRANMYDRASHFRRNNEFDKAMDIYEQILNEDSTDAEAYWSLVLCRYGIEYVEDPLSSRRIPTVNRAQFTSVFDDDNYKSALAYSDGLQRQLYEKEAKEINEIQKGILAISQKEEPFDVFICYKETDNNGRRTPDSVLANDLYHQLVQEGFKVFFARITLEDKLGSAYEPYIFAALNSAKVMVVIGTKQEYFNAVWVKNEWSRYLALIKQGQKKMLIPAYRDMDPYDLPEEFSHLQAQDMSKLGFMQDLIRGIKKIAQTDEPKTTVVKETVIAGGNANTAPLLKRAFMFLEDGDWNSANEYCEKLLDIDPENASAYLGKLMAELHVKKQDRLKDQAEPFDNNNSYQKAVRFADEKLKTALVGYIEHINTRNENDRLDVIYTRAKNAMIAANTESAYKEAAYQFESISEYQDATALANECYEKAEVARKADRLEKERQAEIARKEAERIAKMTKKIDIIATPIVCAVIAFIIILNTVIIPAVKYNNAIKLMNGGEYAKAISVFESLEGYKDSVDKINECEIGILEDKYDSAIKLMNDGEYAKAASCFADLSNYKDSAELLCNSVDGLINSGKYEEAASYINDCAEFFYNSAVSHLDVGKYDEALYLFSVLNEYKDSANKAKICEYMIQGDYKAAVNAGLTHLIIPESVTSIDDSAFYGCSSLVSITIPDSVTSIGDSAFYYCMSLESITIPDSVTSIGNSAFYYCISLKSITISDSVMSIGESAFRVCISLESVTIPDSVTSIGESAFSACSSLESITIPDSVTSIGYYAFSGCSGLESVTIPNSVTSIGHEAFYGCSSLNTVYYGGKASDWDRILIYGGNVNLTSATRHYN